MAGLKAAREPMLRGQQIKQRALPDTEFNRKFAILAPSLNTSDIAIAVGTGLHIYERAVMAMMVQRLSNHWWFQDKDVVLHALEDVALWIGSDALLFSIVNCQQTLRPQTPLDLPPRRL